MKTKPHLPRVSILLPLHQHHRRHIIKPPPKHIIESSKRNNPGIHDHPPIHILRRRINREREKRKSIHQQQIPHGPNINRHPKPTQRPPPSRQRLAPNPLQQHTPNRDNIRRQKRRIRQARNRIQRHAGAQINQRNKRRRQQRHKHGWQGDIPARRHVGEESREWEAAVAGKGPDLARGGGDFRNDGGGEGDYYDGDHGGGGGIVFRGVVEDLDEGEAGRGFEDGGDVAHCEAEGYHHYEAEDAVDEDGAHYCFGEGAGGVFDFFGWGGVSRSQARIWLCMF